MSEYTIFSFRDGKESVRRQMYRKLYGYSNKGVKYPGALSKCDGLKLGAGAIIVPTNCRQKFDDIFKNLSVEFFTLSVQGPELMLSGNTNNTNSNNNQITCE